MVKEIRAIYAAYKNKRENSNNNNDDIVNDDEETEDEVKQTSSLMGLEESNVKKNY